MNFVNFESARFWCFISQYLVKCSLQSYRTYCSIFRKSMMRCSRCLWRSCFNRFRFLAELSTNLQKMHYFGQFKDQLKKEKRELDRWPHFFIHFLSTNCLRYSFLCLKIVKIHFHGVLLLVCSGLQNTWILEVKAARSEFCPVRFRKYTH